MATIDIYSVIGKTSQSVTVGRATNGNDRLNGVNATVASSSVGYGVSSGITEWTPRHCDTSETILDYHHTSGSLRS